MRDAEPQVAIERWRSMRQPSAVVRPPLQCQWFTHHAVGASDCSKPDHRSKTIAARIHSCSATRPRRWPSLDRTHNWYSALPTLQKASCSTCMKQAPINQLLGYHAWNGCRGKAARHRTDRNGSDSTGLDSPTAPSGYLTSSFASAKAVQKRWNWNAYRRSPPGDRRRSTLVSPILFA